MKEHIVRLKAEICQRPAVVHALRAEKAVWKAEKPAGYEKLAAEYPDRRQRLRAAGRVLCLAYAFARGRAYLKVEPHAGNLEPWQRGLLAQRVVKALEGATTEADVTAWMLHIAAVMEVAA